MTPYETQLKYMLDAEMRRRWAVELVLGVSPDALHTTYGGESVLIDLARQLTDFAAGESKS